MIEIFFTIQVEKKIIKFMEKNYSFFRKKKQSSNYILLVHPFSRISFVDHNHITLMKLNSANIGKILIVL
jgi:hypothetical protein